MNQLKVNVNRDSSYMHLVLEGNLTLMDAIEFKHSACEIVNNGKDIIVDLNRVIEIDLTGLNSLLMFKLLCTKAGKNLTIYAYDKHPLFELLELTKFKNQFSFRNSIAKMELVA